MDKKIKAIFVDIDGTLTNGHKYKYEPHQKDINALKRAQKRGIKIILSTGRSREDLLPVWEKIAMVGTGDYAIHSSGAVLENMYTQNVIFDQKIDEFTANKIFDFINKRNLRYKLAGYSTFYRNRRTWVDRMINSSKKMKIEWADRAKLDGSSLRKIGILAFSKRKLNKIYKELTNEIPNIEVARTGSGYYFEITKSGISKASAATAYSELSGIKLEDSMAIGDSENDYKLFEVVGHPAAMKNADRKLKKISRYVTRSVKKNGVATLLDETIL